MTGVPPPVLGEAEMEHPGEPQLAVREGGRDGDVG